MIYISCGLNQEFIIDLLEKTTEEASASNMRENGNQACISRKHRGS